MTAIVILLTVSLYLIAYFTYGKFLSKHLELNDANLTPARAIDDNKDYVPARASLLLGQHFSAISAAGPIVGPILAAIWFGWLPAILWIIIGAIFIGGIHDISSLVASVRHGSASVGELVKKYMSPLSYILFLSFVWITLMYIIIAFTDVTAQTFKAVVGGTAFGPAVAATSIIYLFLAVIMGLLLYYFKLRLSIATAIFVPLILVAVWFGGKLPEPVLNILYGLSVKEWEIILFLYCLVASVTPMWLLLQPRGYLGGWLLYMTIAASLLGALFGGFDISYPAVNLDGLKSIMNGKPLFPILFITIACGACSGFHGIVGSGTTSKQLFKETDARPVAYGAMLLEGLVAILAVITVMILKKGDAALESDPNVIYASGIAKYLTFFGLNYNLALTFALLAFATFVYDTLDVCTRLARYILQELTGWKSMTGALLATLISLVFPLAFLMLTKEKGYLIAWPVFGTSNQLLASLTLLAVAVWLSKTGRKIMFAVIPMIFMMIMTLWSLILLILPLVKSIVFGAAVSVNILTSGVVGAILLGMAGLLIYESVKILIFRRR